MRTIDPDAPRPPTRPPTRRRLPWAALALAVGVLAVLAAVLALRARRSEPTWNGILAEVRQRFPEVPQVATADLARRLAAPEPQRPVLLDAREPAEYAVSHLPGAIPAATFEAAEAVLAELPPERPVVVYCSVGWRSSDLAQRLRRAGHDNVRNLEGSIFRWANEGRPVVRDGRPVAAVHPYDERWGQLLKRELWAWEVADANEDKPPPRVLAGPWRVVDARAEAAVGDGPVYWQVGDGEPPRILESAPLVLPADAGDRPQEVLIVQAVVSPTGRVARFQLLQRPEDPQLVTAITEALSAYRFTPARTTDEPVAVYYNLTLTVSPD